jgi:hypothetical protein
MKIKAMKEIKKKKWIVGATLGLLMKLMSPYEKEKVARVQLELEGWLTRHQGYGPSSHPGT